MQTDAEIYKRGSGGEVRVWRMEQDENRHRTHSGIHGGTITCSGWTTCVAKRGTTPEQQARAEIEANYTKKLKTGYFRRLDQIDQLHFTKPMLAQPYESVTFPVLAQPKLDGMRCIARADGLWSRTGKRILTVPHIAAALALIFEDQPDLIFDGEIYNHDLKDDFGTMMSLARGGDPDGRLQYHIYDVASSSKPVEGRLEVWLDGNVFGTPVLQLVDTVHVGTQNLLDELYAEWLEMGFEGQMIRIKGSLYENKRSKNLLKRKDFLSAEFPVVDVLEGEGNWAGFAKKFVVRLPDGRECGAGVRGNQAKLLALLAGPKPTWATVRYFTPTPEGIPRFPVVIDWGFGEQRND